MRRNLLGFIVASTLLLTGLLAFSYVIPESHQDPCAYIVPILFGIIFTSLGTFGYYAWWIRLDLSADFAGPP